ncbi:zinc-dependent alcohol dehydrogenase [Terrilactibacillus laevilacticus]|uniref:Zinc-binding dehydrogenase n=1 Tax=Terrilactibacillus laevilacticus TaxID=1380157 RepID=A0ABW5PNK7_9BACI|nr:alcohol dehydrogenase catalytic domain-containing protein [Terrilactibacillus laevilacticus]
MKALRNYGIRDIKVEYIEQPILHKNEALIKVLYAGICGSDLHIYRKGMFVKHLPETMGHEFVGQIADIEPNSEFSVGDIVVGDPRVYCMTCLPCKEGDFQCCENLSFIGEAVPGCFAEYLTIPINKLIKVKQSHQLEELALSEPLAVALHVLKQTDIHQDDHIVIFGAGTIGMLILLLLKQVFQVHSVTVVDISEDRLKYCSQLGADQTLNQVEGQETFDKAIETSGVGVCYNTALQVLKAKGTMLVVALYEDELTIDVNPIIYKELNIIGSSAYTFNELKQACQLIDKNHINIKPLITQIIHVEDGPEIFESLMLPIKNDVKILFEF